MTEPKARNPRVRPDSRAIAAAVWARRRSAPSSVLRGVSCTGDALQRPSAPAPAGPAATPTADRVRIALPRDYDETTHRPLLERKVRSRIGPDFELEVVDPMAAEAWAVRGAPAVRPDERKLALAPGAKPTGASMVAAFIRQTLPGWTLVDWSPDDGFAAAGRLDETTVAIRDRVSGFLRCAPWDVELHVRWRLDDQTGLGVVGRVDVLRTPPQSALADRRQELWTEIATTVVGDGSWRAVEDPLTGRVTMEHWDDPLRVAVGYPPDVRPTHRSIPFAIDENGRELTLGLIETNVLLGGVPGGGKSGGLTAYLVGIAQLPHVALIGLDPKMVELSLWRPRASYISVRDAETLAVLALVRDEMERRYAWLADHGLKKVTEDLLSQEMPLLVVVIDELADLVSVGVTKDEKAGDQQRSTLIRRLIAKGRAAGIVVVAATQKPQADVVPTALRDLIQLRVAYATTNAAMSDTILGAGMAGLGGEAHTIPQSLRGVCYVVGETDRHPVRARTYWVPDEEVGEIAQRHAGLRADLPWLTPDAVEQARAELTGEPTLMPRRLPAPKPQPAPEVEVRDVAELELTLDDLDMDDPTEGPTTGIVDELWDV